VGRRAIGVLSGADVDGDQFYGVAQGSGPGAVLDKLLAIAGQADQANAGQLREAFACGVCSCTGVPLPDTCRGISRQFGCRGIS
jgi:hypothetical protein